MKTHITSLLAICFLAAAQSKADTIIEPMQDTGYLLTELTSAPLTLNLFDSNLGTLTGVTLRFWGAMDANGTLTNNSANPQSFTFRQDLAFSFTDNSGSSLDLALQAIGSNGDVDPRATQSYNLASGASGAYGPYLITDTTTITGPLSDFQAVGGGTDTIYVSTLTGDTFIGGGGNISTNISTLGRATMQVTYDYLPVSVPEPSSMLLVAGVLAGSFLIRRRA